MKNLIIETETHRFSRGFWNPKDTTGAFRSPSKQLTDPNPTPKHVPKPYVNPTNLHLHALGSFAKDALAYIDAPFPDEEPEVEEGHVITKLLYALP